MIKYEWTIQKIKLRINPHIQHDAKNKLEICIIDGMYSDNGRRNQRQEENTSECKRQKQNHVCSSSRVLIAFLTHESEENLGIKVYMRKKENGHNHDHTSSWYVPLLRMCLTMSSPFSGEIPRCSAMI
jgi:hypothetical protein